MKTKRYKLIKEYPDSPPLGTIAEKTGPSTVGFTRPDILERKNKSSTIPDYFQRLVLDHPDYWEEIKEPIGYYIRTLQIGEKLYRTKDLHESVESLLTKVNVKIYSIERLSDNAVFSVGDRVEFSHDFDQFELQTIELSKDGKNVELRDGHLFCSLLESKCFVVKPLFTSVDGYEIYKDDTCFYMPKTLAHEPRRFIVKNALNDNTFVFKSLEKALEYYYNHLEILSVADFLNCFDEDDFIDGVIYNKLKERVIEKLAK